MSRPDRLRAMVRADVAIGNALANHRVTDDIRLQRLVFEWTDLVGGRIGARSAPDGISRTGPREHPTRVLWIRVANTAWLQELTLLREQLVASIKAGVGEPTLFDDIRLHLGKPPVPVADLLAGVTIRRPRPAPPRRPTGATADRAREIDRETAAVEDADLRALIRDVRTRNDR